VLAYVPRATQREIAKGPVARKPMPKGAASSLLLGRELQNPPQHAVVSICAKAALNNLRDASGRCKEGVEVGID